MSSVDADCAVAPLRSVAVNVRFLLPGGRLEGIGRFTHEVLSRMVAAHPECTFHFLFDRPYDERWVYAPNVRAHVLRPPARHPVLWFAWFEVAVAAWLLRNRPQVFLSTDGYTTLATRVPRVTVFHDLAFEHFPDDVRTSHMRYYRAFTRRWVRASRPVAVSRATQDDLAGTYGVPAASIEVVGNAVGPEFAPVPEAAGQDVRARFSEGHPYVLFVGALQPRKNLVNLLRAFDQFVEETGTEHRLLLVGRLAWRAGPILDAYEGMRHRDRVLMTGWVEQEDLPLLYGAADVTVYVPHFEGFGIPVLEAQASGSPVITSSCSSLPEVAGAGARLVDPGSPAAIAEALRAVTGDGEMRAELVRLGHANVDRFSWDDSAAALWDVLLGSVDPTRPGGR